MKLATLCYLPPPGIGYVPEFLANIWKYRHYYPIYFYSDHDWKVLPEGCFLAKVDSPEKVKETGNNWSVQKMAFLQSIPLAESMGLDYFLFIEPDCRVKGDNWDRTIFDEAIGSKPISLAGTFYAWDMFNDKREWAEHYATWRSKYCDKPWYSVLHFGSKGCSDPCPAHIFTNGALSVLNTGEMGKLFPWSKSEIISRSNTAYDVSIGYGLMAMYGFRVFERLVPMRSVFSYYGNLLTDEPTRKSMLSETVGLKAIHQIKSNWEGP